MQLDLFCFKHVNMIVTSTQEFSTRVGTIYSTGIDKKYYS